MNNRTVSIIIPSFNKADLILDTIESIYNSDYMGIIEIIIIDDNSTDYLTLDCYKKLINKYPIKIVKNTGKGPSDARNYGFSLSTGEYIIYLDSDDLLSSNFISKSIKFINSLPENIAYVYPNIIMFGDKDGLRVTPKFSSETLKKYNFIPVTCLYRRHALSTINGFRKKLSAMEDWDLFLQLFSEGFEGVKIPNTDLVYLYYRIIKGKGVNASVSKPLKRIKLRQKILTINGYYSLKSWFWHFVAIVYGLIFYRFTDKVELASFSKLPESIRIYPKIILQRRAK